MLGAFVVGFLAALLGSISTGANLVSVPGLIFLGLSPISAIATTRLSAIGGGLAVVYRYNRAKKVLWRYIPQFVVVAVVAGIIGPKLLLNIDERIVEPIVGGLLLASLPLLFLKHNFGEKRQRTTPARKAAGMVVLLLVMIYSTAFSVGGGVFVLYTMAYFFGMTLTEGNATGTVVWVLGAATALLTYISHGAVNISLGLPLVAGAIIGGSIGAQLALDKGVAWVKYVLAVVILVSGLKLLFF